MRHELPGTAAALIRLAVPKSVVLVDEDDVLVARLPTAGFEAAELREFCELVGWEYGDEWTFRRTARYAIDLRPMVADHAARDHRPLLVRTFGRRQ
jgi:hypothetical protein